MTIKLPNGFVVAGETKIFDPRDPSTASGGAEVSDATVSKRGDQWWMYLAGQPGRYGATDIFSASLPAGAPLSAWGWALTRSADGQLIPLSRRDASNAWDGKGGRHCPSYVRGWDPAQGRPVERIYYAGSSEHLWGPYAIGYLEWDGAQWVDQPEPVFVANEEWERGSVYEPNLVYFDGKWMMWYVAGSNHQDYLVHGFAQSEDGQTWNKHSIFAPPEMKMFDFCVREHGAGFEAVFARVSVTGTPVSGETGLWWCSAQRPSGNLADWSQPVQIIDAEDRLWHSGPWKPSLAFDDAQPQRGFVFFDGMYRTGDPGPFPFVFTLGGVELNHVK